MAKAKRLKMSVEVITDLLPDPPEGFTYEVACERQMAVLMEDLEYCKWLDPAGVPCYTTNRVTNPYPKS